MATTKNTPTRITQNELKENVKKINDYFDSLKKIYVGREAVIDMIKYAMLQKAHILLFGVPGTAKTAIADSMFSGITSSTKFEVQMTAFMAEDAIFGPYNIKKMREEGTLEHNIDKMLPTANFASFDEFLDGNPAVLRSLLSALNERRMVKGRQIMDIPLHLAYCCTNVDPYLFMKRNPQAWGVFDRIGFIGRIDYLQEAEDIAEMAKRFQYRTSKVPKGTLDLSVINSVCDYIVMPPTLIGDQLIFMKYGEALVEYREQRREKMKELEKDSSSKNKGEFDVNYEGIIFQEISDRRICWATQMLELKAVLDGRIEVIPEDMLSASAMLGTSETETKIWGAIVNKKVEEIKELKTNDLSELQRLQLENLRNQFEDIRGNGHDLETRINGIATLSQQVKNIKPQNETVNNLFESLTRDVELYSNEVSKELLNSKGLTSS